MTGLQKEMLLNHAKNKKLRYASIARYVGLSTPQTRAKVLKNTLSAEQALAIFEWIYPEYADNFAVFKYLFTDTIYEMPNALTDERKEEKNDKNKRKTKKSKNDKF